MLKLSQYILFLFFLLPAFGQPIIKINTGGAPIIDQYTWTNDKYYSGGTFFKSTNILPLNTSAIYQDVRYGTLFNYRIPLPNGKYNVILKFIEVVESATDRKFDVSINGIKYMTDYNILSDVGFNIPIDKSFIVTTENMNGLNIEFKSSVRSAIIAGIEIDQVPIDLLCNVRIKSLIYNLTTVQMSFDISDSTVNVASVLVFRNGLLMANTIDYYWETPLKITFYAIQQLEIEDIITIVYLY